MSAPAPGSTPMMMPTTIAAHHLQPVFLGQCDLPGEDAAEFPFRDRRRLRTQHRAHTSLTAKTPTKAGITSMPPNRSTEPKVKRGTPPGLSMPMQEIKSPSSMPAMAFTGDERATKVAHIRPRKASQKYSKVEK